MHSLKLQHPDLAILVSLGGDSVAGEVRSPPPTFLPYRLFVQVFRSIVSRKDQLANFTSSLNSLYQDEIIQVSCCMQWSDLDFVLQGVEMDWEWPIDTGDKKDKIKLIRYMRVSR